MLFIVWCCGKRVMYRKSIFLAAGVTITEIRTREKSSYIFWIFVKADVDEIDERPFEVTLEFRGRIFWDEEKGSHRIKLCMGWLPLGQLYGRDA